MATKEFDDKFRKLYTEMVEIAFDLVDSNEEEVDTIYIYASMENKQMFFNAFYRINGKLVKMHEINSVSNEEYDLSQDTMFDLLRQGNTLLKETMELFKSDDREVPTLMKMEFHPKTGKFDNDISYELYHSNHATRTNADVFKEWFEEIKSSEK
jgi:hypothetical protein